MPVIFHIPDVDTVIADDLVEVLLEELTLTARPSTASRQRGRSATFAAGRWRDAWT